MGRGELPPALRRAGLEEERRALRRGLGEMRPLHRVVGAVMVDGVDLRGVGVDAASGVAQHGVILPASLPQLVGDLQILLGARVALVVGRQPAEAEILARVGQVGGHDVPGDPAAAEVIQRRDLAGEGEGRDLKHGAREGEAEMLGRHRHGRNQRRRVVRRDLHRFLDRGLGPAQVEVVGADDIRQEERVEAALFQQPRQLDPGLGPVVVALARVVPHPEAVLDVGDAVHRERVEMDALAHAPSSPGLRPCGSAAAVQHGTPAPHAKCAHPSATR